jgi:hypothetical protein
MYQREAAGKRRRAAQFRANALFGAALAGQKLGRFGAVLSGQTALYRSRLFSVTGWIGQVGLFAGDVNIVANQRAKSNLPTVW